MCVCVRACVRTCVRACVRVCFGARMLLASRSNWYIVLWKTLNTVVQIPAASGDGLKSMEPAVSVLCAPRWHGGSSLCRRIWCGRCHPLKSVVDVVIPSNLLWTLSSPQICCGRCHPLISGVDVVIPSNLLWTLSSPHIWCGRCHPLISGVDVVIPSNLVWTLSSPEIMIE